MKKHYLIIDSSAILSGKTINIRDKCMVTTPGVSSEFSPGGRDYTMFQLLKEKGLIIMIPGLESIEEVKRAAQKTGDKERLSHTDMEVLALALEINSEDAKEASILSDDYSIQNVADSLSIKVQHFSQKGITKKFKWQYRCPGCRKRFSEAIKICPICGTETKLIVKSKDNIK
jgi:UPF0271 protein